MPNLFKISRFFLYLVPFTVVIVTPSTLFPYIVGKYAFFRTIVGISFILFLLGLLFGDRADKYMKKLKKVFKSPLTIAVSIFTFAFVLASLFGVDPSFSFWSNFERGEGGLQILFLFILFILVSTLLQSKRHWKKLLWMVVLAALFMILYGIGAGIKHVDATIEMQNGQRVLKESGPIYQTFSNFLGPTFDQESFRFQGTIGNPAYVAAHLIFAMFFTFYLLVSRGEEKNKEWQKTLLIIALVVFAFFFLLAATRGAFLGLAAGLFVGLIYLAYSKKAWRKYIATLLLLGVVVLVGGVIFQDHPAMENVPGSRVFDVSLDAKTFQDRLIMWGIAWEGFLERPLLGWGPENYIEVFYRHYDPNYYTPGEGYGAWFDRAHNLIFDYLAETGALGALSYLSIYAVLGWLMFKRFIKRGVRKAKESFEHESETLNILLAASFIGLPVAYFVQGMVLFEVLAIYLPLFIFLGLVNYKFVIKDRVDKKHV